MNQDLSVASRHRSPMGQGADGYAATGGNESVPVIRQYLQIAYRRRIVIAAVTMAFILLGVVVTLLMTPKYSAVALIEIARESDRVTNFQGVEREAGVADQEFYQTQYGLLRSQSLAESVASELKLVNDPKFFEMFRAQDDRIPALQLVDGRYAAAGRAERQRLAGEILLDHLGVEPVRLSRLVRVSFTSPDPKFSATVTNVWAENFIRTNLERKVQATSYGREVLQRQLAQLKQRLDESQRQLVGYAASERLINLPAQGNGGVERSIVADDLAALNVALADATSDRIQAEARSQQAGRSGASSQALSNTAINGLRQRRAELAAEYERLMTQFEPGYPSARAIKSQLEELDQSISREERRVLASLTTDYRQAQTREDELRAKVEALKASYLDVQRRSIQYNIYKQEVDSNRALYDGLLNRFKEIGVAGGVGVNNISFVDRADIPKKPSSPRVMLNLLAALVLGLGFGVAAALLLEQIDESILDPEEIERHFGLAVLGSVPKVKQGDTLDELSDRKSAFFDAYLTIFTNLGFTTEHGVPRSLSVTSSRPGEGKSTSALSLATALSRAGRRTILVDGDMRSPSVHALVNAKNDRGLSNYLAGSENVDGLIDWANGFEIATMSAGPPPPNAAELLAGKRMSSLVEALLEKFDHVVIDSPPVMGLADAPLIGSHVEAVVYVIESQGSRLSLVKTAIGRMRLANAHIVGGILTKFKPRRSNYGYGYGYGQDESAEA